MILLLFWLPLSPCTNVSEIASRRLQNTTSCSFNDLFASICSLEIYCDTLRINQGITATCSGLITGEWNIWIQFDELCYPAAAREDSFARHTGELPEFGFCSMESAYFNYRGFVLENSQHQEIVTYPKEAKGLVQQMTFYTPCEDSVADTFFGRGYCADPCPQTKLQGSLVCGEQCLMCSDGKQVLDCSNIDANLVEQCDDESAFLRALLAYLKAESSGSLSSELFNNNNNSTDLETTDTGGDSEQEIITDEEAPSVAINGTNGEDNVPTTGLDSSASLWTSALRNLALLLATAIVAQ